MPSPPRSGRSARRTGTSPWSVGWWAVPLHARRKDGRAGGPTTVRWALPVERVVGGRSGCACMHASSRSRGSWARRAAAACRPGKARAAAQRHGALALPRARPCPVSRVLVACVSPLRERWSALRATLLAWPCTDAPRFAYSCLPICTSLCSRAVPRVCARCLLGLSVTPMEIMYCKSTALPVTISNSVQVKQQHSRWVTSKKKHFRWVK
jgi:hypothetical protein